MRTVIEIHDVPAPLRRRLEARAALEGVSLSRFIVRELEKALQCPSRRELIARIASQPEAVLDPTPAEILRIERGSC